MLLEEITCLTETKRSFHSARSLTRKLKREWCYVTVVTSPQTGFDATIYSLIYLCLCCYLLTNCSVIVLFSYLYWLIIIAPKYGSLGIVSSVSASKLEQLCGFTREIKSVLAVFTLRKSKRVSPHKSGGVCRQFRSSLQLFFSEVGNSN